jgi:tRNA(fMet)-specific endonuclease VapC
MRSFRTSTASAGGGATGRRPTSIEFVYCFDTDVLSALIRSEPSIRLARRVASVAPEEQCTTAITLAELIYGVARRGSKQLAAQVDAVVRSALTILPFDASAAETHGPLRAELERQGRRLAEPDLRIASIVLSRDLTLVTGNVRHFERVPGLRLEDWLRSSP